MTYRRFEILVIICGGGAILTTAAAAATRQSDWIETVGQLLLLGVLVGALHWGRRGGFIAGIAATLVYLALRVPTIAAARSLTPTLAQLLLTRAVVFGALGIVGGEISTRIKYFFVELENRGHIDDVTHVYNDVYVRQLLRSHVARYERYSATFSIIIVRLDEAKLPPLDRSHGRRLLRATANALVGDIRLVDEMGRLEGAEFCIILPNTPLEGAKVAAARLKNTAGGSLHGTGLHPDGIVTAEPLGYPEDREAIEVLLPPLTDEPADRRA